MVGRITGVRFVVALTALMGLLLALVPPGPADATAGVTAPPVNLTLNATAAQSSTTSGYGADRAIDGSTYGVLTSGSVSQTSSETTAWWAADLGSVSSIPVVKVHARTDTTIGALSSFSVFVSDAPFTSTSISATRTQPGVSEYLVTGNASQVITVPVDRTGRYVRVQIHGTGRLELAEVQVGGPTFEIQPDVVPSWGVRGRNESLNDNVEAEVFAIEQIGNMLYVGGRFKEAVPTRFGAGVDQPYLMALDATTGNLISTFRPRLNGAVYTLQASPDGARLFVGGEFYSVNDEPNTGGIVALDPVTGEVQQDWTSHLSRYWAVGPAMVKSFDIAGGYLYAGGLFTHATDSSGTRSNVYNVARFRLSDSRLDTSWRPNVTGGAVWGVAASESWNRVYLGGKFTAVNGSTRTSFAAVTMDSGSLTGPSSITRNSTGQTDIYDVVAVGDLVFVAGSEHSTIVFNASDFSIRNWVFTNNAGGDNQDLEVVGDRVYSTCHCRGDSSNGGVWDNYRPGSSWTVIAQGTYMGEVEGVYALSAKTGAFIRSFPFSQFEDEWSMSAGGWAIHGAPDGCLWLGGDFNLEAVGGSYVNSLARVCLEGGPRQLGLTTPTPPVDTVAPPPVTGPSATAAGTTVTVRFTRPGNTSDVAAYAIYRNGGLIAKSDATTVTLRNQPSGVWTYSVASVDRRGNLAAPVSAAALWVDPGAYTEYVDADFDNWLAGAEYLPFTFSSGVFGGNKPERAVPMYTPDGAETDDGAAVVMLGGKVLSGSPTVTDMAGAFTTTFTVDQTGPATLRLDRRIFSGASAGTVSARVAIDGVVTILGSQGSSVSGAWTAHTIPLGTLTAGTHTLAIGGLQTSKSYSFANWWSRIVFDDVRVYSERPGLGVLDAPTAPVSGTSLPVTVRTSDALTPTSALSVSITPSWTGATNTIPYDATSGTFKTTLSLVGVADGSRSYVVTVVDGSGYSTSQTIPVTVQNASPPSVTIEAPAQGSILRDSVDVVAAATDATDAPSALQVETSVNGAAWIPLAWNGTRHVGSLSLAGVADGPATITVRATDTTGLVATAAVQITRSSTGPGYDQVVGAGPLPSAWWRLGESSGTQARDSVVSLHATYVGSPLLGFAGLVSGADTAVLFDGVDDAIDVPDSTLINTGSAKTAASIEAWFSPTDVSRRQVIYEQGGSTRGAAVYVEGGMLFGGYWNTANDASADTPWASGPAFVSTPISAGSPHHVVVTYSRTAGTVVMYLDGVEAGRVTGVGTLFPHGSDIGIGAMNDAARFADGTTSNGRGFRFGGVIDEVAVYGFALDPAVIAAHAAAHP